eukprot:m.230244 g.230244  ORF g.230244 m.230244 type:complete len:305 (+) comp26020_c0_seq2:479-1393(+)
MSETDVTPSASGRAVFQTTLKSARIYLLSFPAGTRIILAICITMHILGQVIGPSFAARFCIVPELVYQGQLYRLVTHSIVHGSWIHLGLNMVSLLPLGPKLEENLGTLPFLALQLHAAFLGGIVYILLTFVVGAPRYRNVCVLGYSGVLLSTLVVFVYKFSTNEAIKIFGVIQVPNTLAPWACLLLFQLIPNVSFFGHLAGILVGYAMYGGGMRRLLPSQATLESVSQRGPCGMMARMPGYVKPPSSGGLPISISNGVATTGAGPSATPNAAGRFPGVGRQLLPAGEHGASLYEEDSGEGEDVE